MRDGRTLLVSVFDEGTSNAVERAIRAAGLNLNPICDGPSKLKVPIPKPTEKAREGYAKVSAEERLYVLWVIDGCTSLTSS